jgi:hypothetical protein
MLSIEIETTNTQTDNAFTTATQAFEILYAADTQHLDDKVCNLTFHAQASYKDIIANKALNDVDLLIIPGGEVSAIDRIIKNKEQPLALLQAYVDVQAKHPERERTVLAIGTASILMVEKGLLHGLSATTHPDYFVKFENLVSRTAQRDLATDRRCNLLEERYVVNNLRYDLGENLDENPYVRKKSDAGKRRPSNARKGSNARRESNTRRESFVRRANMLLGGLRVITTGGTSCAVDASLYLVSIMVSLECAEEVARVMQHTWGKGVVVDGIDI